MGLFSKIKSAVSKVTDKVGDGLRAVDPISSKNAVGRIAGPVLRPAIATAATATGVTAIQAGLTYGARAVGIQGRLLSSSERILDRAPLDNLRGAAIGASGGVAGAVKVGTTLAQGIANETRPPIDGSAPVTTTAAPAPSFLAFLFPGAFT